MTDADDADDRQPDDAGDQEDEDANVCKTCGSGIAADIDDS